MKILITGAHHTPAVAVIEELRKDPKVEIVYVGREYTMEGDSVKSIESQVIPSLGVKFIPITAGRLQRSFTLHTIPSLIKIPFGFLQALFIILRTRPDVVLSFGGYISVPVVIAGWLFSIPIIIHEQTLVNGLANRICANFANKVALSFKNKQVIEGKYILTGNPIRKNIKSTYKLDDLDIEIQKLFKVAKSQHLPVILIMGGNQGSHIINLNVEKIIKNLTKIACVIHISGDNKYQDFERLKSLGDFDDRYKVFRWIGEDYGAVLQKIDLIISRAGINTLTEAALLGKPALVIPIPYLYQDEQNKNAQYFNKLGMVEITAQSELSKDNLFKKVKQMIENLDQLTINAKNAKDAILVNAEKRLALEVMLLIKESNEQKKI